MRTDYLAYHAINLLLAARCEEGIAKVRSPNLSLPMLDSLWMEITMIEKQMAEDNMIVKVITGSRLYGTDTPDSDYDYQAIFIPNKEYVYGLKSCNEVGMNHKVVIKDKEVQVDYKSYNIVKFIDLAIKNNPNILSLFFTPDNCFINKTDWGKELIEKRDLFLSKKAYHSFRGYAHAQKRKILTKDPIGKRKELIEKYGHDVKFSMNLIRLLYECLDIMTVKQIVYPSPHRKMLKLVRNGEWSMDQVFAEADRVEKLVDEAYVRSDLQHSPNFDAIEKFKMRILEEYWVKQEMENR